MSLDGLVQALQSPFSTALLLLVFSYALVKWTRKQIERQRHELRAAILECRKDGLTDAGFLYTASNLTHQYRLLLLGQLGGKREPPRELAKIDERFEKFRRELHDERSMRKLRLDRSLEKEERASENSDGDE